MQDLKSALSQFYGSDNYYPHWAKVIRFTDGVKYLADKAGAYWLIDIVASYRRKEPFQIWTLKVKDKQGIVEMREDTNTPVLVSQEIPYTDFPLDTIKLYLVGNILMLTTEY
jgi:hypothetical protein